jgi:hypothetical protein
MRHYRLLIAIIAIVGMAGISSAGWVQTSSYPHPITISSCTEYGGYIYCVGGWTANALGGNYSIINGSYYAKLNGNGIGPWSATTGYPKNVSGESCEANSGYLYCVGGGPGLERPANFSFYATVSADGIGKWQKTANYPGNTILQSCGTYNQSIYCIGGYGSNATVAYFANLSPGGIGDWRKMSSYPIYSLSQGCGINGDYVYCIGGLSNIEIRNSTYYNKIDAMGIEGWKATTPYPIGIYGQSCVVNNDEIYCIAGSTGDQTARFAFNTTATGASYMANLSSMGIGNWTMFEAYPLNFSGEGCVAYNQTIYCVGGWDGLKVGDESFYYSLNPNATVTIPMQEVNTTTSTVPEQSTVSKTQSAGPSKSAYMMIFLSVVVIGGVISVFAIAAMNAAYRKGRKSGRV